MTSATDELRRLLDERRVEWVASGTDTCWKSVDGYPMRAWDTTNGTHMRVADLTPEQAVEATLGRGTCEVIGFDDGYDEGLDGEWFALAPATWFLSCDHEAHGRRPSYCPVCGRNVKEG